jgi:hypothetical protein
LWWSLLKDLFRVSLNKQIIQHQPGENSQADPVVIQKRLKTERFFAVKDQFLLKRQAPPLPEVRRNKIGPAK